MLCSALDSQVLAIELRDHPELAEKVRAIGTIGPSTIQPVVASSSRLTADERRSIAEVLIGAAEDARARPLMDAAFVSRFTAIDDRGYDDIRGMLSRVEAAGLTGPQWRANWAALTQGEAAAL